MSRLRQVAHRRDELILEEEKKRAGGEAPKALVDLSEPAE
jgi:hypothetical protein